MDGASGASGASDDAARAAARLEAAADLVTPMVLRVAATLRLADHLAAAPATPADLADVVGADLEALRVLLAHLATVGVVACDGDGRWTLTELGAALRDDEPSGLRDRLDVEGALGRAELAFVHLLAAVRDGQPSYQRQYGNDFWSDLDRDPQRRASFDAQMGADVARWAPAITGALDWATVGHVVDVGGGDGTLLAALLRAHPTLRGTVVDRPATAEAARRTLAAAGVGDRADAVAGSFFDPLPPGAGAYLCCAVLHNWPDGAARTILERCAAAVRSAGRVVVVEKTGQPEGTLPTAMAIRALVWFGGRERSAEELAELGAAAGLRTDAVVHAGALSILSLSRSEGSPRTA